jgi:hypothetical protein
VKLVLTKSVYPRIKGMCWKKKVHGFSCRLHYLQLLPDCQFAFGQAVPASGVQRKTKREAKSCYESLRGKGVMGVAKQAKAKNFSQTSNFISPTHCCKSSERFGLKCEFSIVSNKYIPYIHCCKSSERFGLKCEF